MRLEALIRRFWARASEIGASGCPESHDLVLPRPALPPGLSRRGFLQALAIGGAGLVVAGQIDLDRLLWTPGQTVAVGGLEASEFLLTPSWVTMEALRILHENLAFTTYINRHYTDIFDATADASALTVPFPKQWSRL